MLDYKRILAPVDLASLSHSVLERAARHSQESGSEFWVTHIVDPDLHRYVESGGKEDKKYYRFCYL